MALYWSESCCLIWSPQPWTSYFPPRLVVQVSLTFFIPASTPSIFYKGVLESICLAAYWNWRFQLWWYPTFMSWVGARPGLPDMTALYVFVELTTWDQSTASLYQLGSKQIWSLNTDNFSKACHIKKNVNFDFCIKLNFIFKIKLNINQHWFQWENCCIYRKMICNKCKKRGLVPCCQINKKKYESVD